MRKQNETFNLMMNVQGEGKSGMTIYAAEKRIPIHYRVFDRDGKELASGTMNYG